MKVITVEAFNKFYKSIKNHIPCSIDRKQFEWPEEIEVELIAIKQPQIATVTITDIFPPVGPLGALSR
jgi:hypothetical protein